jgi:hypothetical protein
MTPEEPEGPIELELTEKQLIVLGELAAGKSQLDAAKAAPVTDRTVRLWLKQPVFSRALRERRAELWALCTNQMHASAALAVEVLKRACLNADAREWERVAAAKTMVEFTRKAAETEDLRARIQELEERVAALAAETERQRDRGTERGSESA